jgi:hypothetical protein
MGKTKFFDIIILLLLIRIAIFSTLYSIFVSFPSISMTKIGLALHQHRFFIKKNINPPNINTNCTSSIYENAKGTIWVIFKEIKISKDIHHIFFLSKNFTKRYRIIRHFEIRVLN